VVAVQNLVAVCETRWVYIKVTNCSGAGVSPLKLQWHVGLHLFSRRDTVPNLLNL